MHSMASSRWHCWKTARTSITESMSSPRGCVFPDRRLRRLAKKVAQGADAGVARGGMVRIGKSEDVPAAVRLYRVAEVNRLGVREPDDGRRMEPHADRQPLGQVLIGRFAGDERRTIARRRSGGVAPVPDEVSLRLGRIEPLPWICDFEDASNAAHSRSKSISSLAMA